MDANQVESNRTEADKTDAGVGNDKGGEKGAGEKGNCGFRGCGHRRGGVVLVLVTALVAGSAGGFIGKSFAQGPFGGSSALSAPIDPTKVDARVERMIKRFAGRVDATPEQRGKLEVIAKGAARDLMPLREKLHSARQDAIALAGAPDVDRAALEKLRAGQIALADSASKRMTQALADAAEVLTPQQRQKLAERMQSRSERRSWWQRG